MVKKITNHYTKGHLTKESELDILLNFFKFFEEMKRMLQFGATVVCGTTKNNLDKSNDQCYPCEEFKKSI